MAASCQILLYCTLVFGGFLVLSSNAQLSSRSLIPSSIVRNCYHNTTAFQRYRRQPMHMDNLIAIIKKIERKNPFWTIRQTCRAIVRNYQFDGLKYDPNSRLPELAYSQETRESAKTKIIHDLMPLAENTIQEGDLDNDERCALHWMLSHSINATMRDDEEIERYGRFGQLRAKRSSPEAGTLDLESDNDPERAKRVVRQADARTTRWPVETGVVLTPWGSVSAGRVLAGITAGLEPQTKDVVYVPILSRDAGIGGSGGAIPGIPSSGSTGNNWQSGGSIPNNPSGSADGSYPNNPGGGSGGWNTGNGNNRPGGGYPGNNGGANPNNPNSGYNNNNGGRGNPNNPFSSGRRKRQINITFEPLESLYAATLGGEIGQAAVLNARFQNQQSRAPPAGSWNDTICPREYTLNALPDPAQQVSHDHDTWSYMTAAEVRGGVDGLILGAKIYDWDRANPLRLSQVLQMYYSNNGYAYEPIYRACDRSGLYGTVMPANKLIEQGRSFAYLFNQKTQEMSINDDTLNAFLDNVNLAQQRLSAFASSLSSIDPQCTRRPPSYGSSEIPDREKYTEAKSTVFAVLDHSVANIQALVQQQRFVGQLAYELNIRERGSRLGLVDGRGGQILINPNLTDSAAIAACRVIDQQIFLPTQDVPAALRTIRSEIDRIRVIERQTEFNIGVGNGIVILIFVQSARLPDNRRDEIASLINELDYGFGDVKVIFTSSTLNQNDFQGYEFIRIRGSQNISDDADEFMTEFLQKTHGRLYYPRCNTAEYDQSEEYRISNDIWLNPGSIQYYKISPTYFYSNLDLRLRFSSDRGRVRVCFSRDVTHPSSINGGTCWETSGNYVEPGSNGKDLEITYDRPCEKRKRDRCEPVYLSFTLININAQGAAGVICSEYGCETPDQIRLTWSHWNMRCGAVSIFANLTAIIAALLFSFYRYF